MGVKGVTIAEGCTDANLLDVQLKGVALQRTRELIILADHSKLGNIGLSSFAALSQVRAVITDEKADAEIVQTMRETGVEVIVAPLSKNGS